MTAVEQVLIERRHRWAVTKLQHLIECGAFLPEDRIELIEGELVDMAPIGPEHAECVDELTDQLSRRGRRRFRVRVQNPVLLNDWSAPQPDIALVRQARYDKQHPQVNDILLIIEVADTTAHYDRTVKVPLYARHGIPEMWLIDLPKRVIEVYREPVGDDYCVLKHHTQGKIVCAELVDVWLCVEDVLPRA